MLGFALCISKFWVDKSKCQEKKFLRVSAISQKALGSSAVNGCIKGMKWACTLESVLASSVNTQTGSSLYRSHQCGHSELLDSFCFHIRANSAFSVIFLKLSCYWIQDNVRRLFQWQKQTSHTQFFLHPSVLSNITDFIYFLNRLTSSNSANVK